MDVYVLIVVSVLLLLSYFFDLTSQKTKIPTVLILLVLGWLLQQVVIYLNMSLPAIETLLPSIGTIGLILIVFEATIDLKYSPEKLPIFLKSIVFSLLSIFVFSFAFSLILHVWMQESFYIAFLHAVPFSVISSAIAIPSVYNYKHLKEFIVYDSTFSDIFGILIFNLVLALEQGNVGKTIGLYFIELIGLLIFSVVAIIMLAFFMRNIKYQVKFIPILIFIVLLYMIMKVLHLPGLIFVLIFGLSIANFEHIIQAKEKSLSHFSIVLNEIPFFKTIVSELTFLVRSLFFLLLGYSFRFTWDNFLESFMLIMLVLILIYFVRLLLLRVVKCSVKNYLFIAPRGLITLVLFFSIPERLRVDYINETVAVFIVMLTVVIMSLSLYYSSRSVPS